MLRCWQQLLHQQHDSVVLPDDFSFKLNKHELGTTLSLNTVIKITMNLLKVRRVHCRQLNHFVCSYGSHSKQFLTGIWYDQYIHHVQQKGATIILPLTFEMLTDFKNSFTNRLIRKFVIKR